MYKDLFQKIFLIAEIELLIHLFEYIDLKIKQDFKLEIKSSLQSE